MFNFLQERFGRQISIFNICVLVIAVSYFYYDVIADFLTQTPSVSLYIEAIVYSFAAFALCWEIVAGIKAKHNFEKQIESIKNESDNVQNTDLAQMIYNQFDKWKLTPSEQDIAWLIIKGFSFIEIAALREVKDKTVRQQATSIYSKADVANRSEFTASFIEDLIFKSQEDNAQAKIKSSQNDL